MAQQFIAPFVKMRANPVGVAGGREKIRLQFHQCPGDTLVATGAVFSLMKAYPERFQIDVEGTDCKHIFENNPAVTFGSGGRQIKMDNPLISHCDKRPVHFLESYCYQLQKALGVPVPLATNRPQLFLSEQEKHWIPQVEEITGEKTRYWVVNAGVKKDYTVKGWGRHNYQKTVDLLRGEVQFVQVGLKEHNHPALEGVIDLRGRTDTRQLIRLCYHAAGGIGGESFNHHLFAALQRPFVLLLSGFLPRTWVDYPRPTRILFAWIFRVFSTQPGRKQVIWGFKIAKP